MEKRFLCKAITVLNMKSACKKASQSSRPQTRKNEIIFHRDMCVGKNTSQAASVEF